MRILSFGAGVQPSAMLLMGLDGRFGDKPDRAVFADAGWEPRAVYDWLATIEAIVAPFPIDRVSGGSIRANTSPQGRFVALPMFLDSGGIGRRQCTNEFKLAPMRKHFRSFGATAKKPIECWIGISTDEAHRMKPSRVKYAVNRYPLIETGLSREDCQNYLIERVGKKAPKSACIGCPFHSDATWTEMRQLHPEEFEDACRFDEEFRETRGMKAKQFLHRSLVPLRQIQEFRHENQGRMFWDGFGNECEGMCGL